VEAVAVETYKIDDRNTLAASREDLGACGYAPAYCLESTVSTSTEVRQTFATLKACDAGALSDVSKLTLCETKWAFRLEVSEIPVSV
jgi:hypothetical protein